MTYIQSLLVAVVQHEDVETSMRALLDAGLKITLISSMGGFLREGNVTLLLGLARKDVPVAIKLLSAHCRQRSAYVNAVPYVPAAGSAQFIAPIEIHIGGATVFVLPTEQFIHMDAQHRTYTLEPQERSQTTMNMKLILAIVPEELANGILDTLVDAKYGATLISTTGGFLRKGNATLLIGVEAAKTQDALQRIERFCTEMLAKLNVADTSTNIFVLDVEQFANIGLGATTAAANPNTLPVTS